METSRRILLWAPRLLLILFALFLVVFSFDVFEQGKGAIDIGIAFVMHNIPSIILALTAYAAWRREWIGGAVCLALAAIWIAWAWERFPVQDYFMNYVFIAGPLILVAALYMANWHIRNSATRES